MTDTSWDEELRRIAEMSEEEVRDELIRLGFDPDAVRQQGEELARTLLEQRKRLGKDEP